jgi:hypothetical protein
MSVKQTFDVQSAPTGRVVKSADSICSDEGSANAIAAVKTHKAPATLLIDTQRIAVPFQACGTGRSWSLVRTDREPPTGTNRASSLTEHDLYRLDGILIHVAIQTDGDQRDYRARSAAYIPFDPILQIDRQFAEWQTCCRR